MLIFAPVLERLCEQGGRFVVVGGLAVVLHGHPRLTVDLDLVVDLEPAAAAKTIAALTSLGLRPLAPVAAAEFVDPERRREWIEEKGMRVFSLYDPNDPLRIVDLFVEAPLERLRWLEAAIALAHAAGAVRRRLPETLPLAALPSRPRD